MGMHPSCSRHDVDNVEAVVKAVAALHRVELRTRDKRLRYRSTLFKDSTSKRNYKNLREVRKYEEDQKECSIAHKSEHKPARKLLTKMADLKTFTLPGRKRRSLEHHIKTTIAYQSYTRRHMTIHRTIINKSWSMYTKLWLKELRNLVDSKLRIDDR